MRSASWRLVRIGVEIKIQCSANRTFTEASNQHAVANGTLRLALGDERFKLGEGECGEAVDEGARANGGRELLRIFREQNQRGVFGCGLLDNLDIIIE